VRVLRAFRNMLGAAVRDPLSTFLAILWSPLTAGGYIAKLLFILAVIYLVAYDVLKLFIAIHHTGQSFPAQSILDLFMGVITVVLVWRWLTAPLLRHFGDKASDTHGSARFATKQETASLAQSAGGLLVGRDVKTGKLLRYAGPAHLLTIAPTRSGKGVGTIIPNLLTARRAVVCIDPKGENARIAGRAREQLGPLHVLDPFGVTGRPSAAFNPLAALDAASLDVAEDAASLADALVYDTPNEGGEAHWNEEAKALIAGVILYVIAEEPPERRTLATLRDLLTGAPEDFKALLTRMQGTAAAGNLIARAANRHRGKSDAEAAGVLSTAQRHTHFLDSPRMTSVLGRSDFSFADLKAGLATVFLVLPPDRLATYARWLRLMLTQSLQDMARTPARSAAPVLFLLDEFAALGHLAPIERAMGLMAGYGVQLWPILQDIHQLRATYGQRAGTFLSNAGMLQVFGVNDHESARLVSDLLGQETIVFETASRALDSRESGLSYSEQHTGRPLLTPDEVRNLPESRALLFPAGKRPILARKLRYYADAEFARLYDRA
jgi:type IV secretion system protein VirD4